MDRDTLTSKIAHGKKEIKICEDIEKRVPDIQDKLKMVNALEDEQNFTMVMEMLNYAEVKEDEDDYESPLDELFKRLETIDSNSLALKQYKIYKQAAGKTAKSILISVGVRLAAFNLEELASLTRYDEMELEQKILSFAAV